MNFRRVTLGVGALLIVSAAIFLGSAVDFGRANGSPTKIDYLCAHDSSGRLEYSKTANCGKKKTLVDLADGEVIDACRLLPGERVRMVAAQSDCSATQPYLLIPDEDIQLFFCVEKTNKLLRYVTSTSQCTSQEFAAVIEPQDAPPVAVDDLATVAEDAPATPILVLANDTNPDGGPMVIASVNTTGTNGAVAITNAGADLTYQPNANYCNTQPGGTPDSFTYTLNGGDSATVSVTVTCVDDPPTAVNDTATVVEDSGATALDVLANDTDIDAVPGPKAIASASDPGNGTVVLTGGSPGQHTGLTYQPDANYCGPDSFTYTLTPGTSSATVTITVTCVDDAPTAVDDSATVGEDSGATAVNVLTNDTDVDVVPGPKSIASVTQPANGAVVITGGGTGLTYQPNANYCNNPPGTTPDTFTYTLAPGSSVATVSVAVTCVDDAPVAVNDSPTVTQNSGASAINVLANDTDVDGGPKTIDSVTQPINGTVVIAADNLSLTYQPAANYCNDTPGGSPDTFTYTLNGGSSATVSVTVNCDAPPVAVDDPGTVAEDAAATTIDVLTNDTNPDGGPKVIASATQPANGTVVLTGGSVGAHTGLTYKPGANYCNNPPGTTLDTFTYTLNGGSSATVTVTVTCVDDTPAAVADSATVVEDSGANAIDVLANDTDIDAGPISVASVTQPTNGAVVITGGGTGLTYAPTANYCNSQSGGTPDTFAYTLNGGDTATVSVTVTCVAEAATAVADSASVNEDAVATPVNVLVNDSNPDAAPMTITNATDPANGTVVVAGDGLSLTYQPDANYCNTSPPFDTFDYTITGGSTATVSVTVTCVNDAPSFTKGADQTVAEDAGAQTVPGWATAISKGPADESAQTLTFVVTDNTNPTLFSAGPAVSPTGTLTYTPAANQNGTATITITLSDNGGGTDTSPPQQFDITVTAVNDAPVAQTKTASAHTNMTVAGMNPGLLAGVTDADSGIDSCSPTFSVASITASTGGSVSNVNLGTGTFDFNPAPGFSGTAVVNYTVQDTGCPGTATSAPAAINITVAGPVIWFVDDTASSTGANGTLAHPFTTLAAAAAVDAASHRIFLYSGTYGDGIALNSGEWLIGQGVTDPSGTFDGLMGITPPAGTIVRPPIATGTATVQGTVGLATNSVVRGVAISSVAATAITGSSITGVNVSQTSVTTTTGTGVSLASAVGTYSFTSLTTGGGTGASLTGANAGATFSFAAVTISSGGNPGFLSTGGGTLTISGATNTIVTTSGTALNVSNTTIGADGLTFQSISSNGAVNGIVLNNTGATAGLTVTGNSAGLCGGSVGSGPPAAAATATAPATADCTGGVIQNTTGAGIILNTTRDVSLTRMRVVGSGDDGIQGTSVTNFTLGSSLIENNGNAIGEAGLDFGGVGNATPNGLFGTASITNSTVRNSFENNLSVRNQSGTLSLTVTGSQFTNVSANASSSDGILLDIIGTASLTSSIQNNYFAANGGDHFQAAASNSASHNVTFKNNTLTGGHSTALGQGITINAATGVASGGYTGRVDYDVDGNNIQGAISNAVITNLGTSGAAGVFDGFIRNNIIGTTGVALSGSAQANCIAIDAHGNGNHIVSVTNNTMRRCFDRGIFILASDGNGSANVTVTGNTVNDMLDINGVLGTPREAFHISTGATSTNVFGQVDSHAVCLNLSNNTLDSPANFVTEDVRLRQRFRTSIRLPGYAGTAFDAAAVKSFVEGNNPGGEIVTATFVDDVAVTSDGYFGGAACTTPS